MAPRVSICIPAFNTAQFLGAAIESALAQDVDDLEVVVADNASTDGTPELCRRYGDTRFRTVRFEEHVSQAANWNRCLDLARGEFVVLLHADDLLRPGFAAAASDLLGGEPACAFVHCAVEHIDAAGQPMSVQRLRDSAVVEPGGEMFARLATRGCLINPAGTMVRRTAYEQVGRFTGQVEWGVDWHMWMRLALQGDVAYLADALAAYRHHGASGTEKVIASARHVRDEEWVIDDIFSHLPPAHADQKQLLGAARRASAHRMWYMAEEACRRGHGWATRTSLAGALRLDPALWRRPAVWALWAASWAGYPWLERARRLKRAPGAPA